LSDPVSLQPMVVSSALAVVLVEVQAVMVNVPLVPPLSACAVGVKPTLATRT